jgi:hypothetical protein
MKNHIIIFTAERQFSFCTKEIWCRKDNTGAALPGVNIVEKGTKTESQLIWMVLTKLKLNEGATSF